MSAIDPNSVQDTKSDTVGRNTSEVEKEVKWDGDKRKQTQGKRVRKADRAHKTIYSRWGLPANVDGE